VILSCKFGVPHLDATREEFDNEALSLETAINQTIYPKDNNGLFFISF